MTGRVPAGQHGQLPRVVDGTAVASARVLRRLAEAQSIDDLRSIARKLTPRAVFDYVDGGAEGEESLRRARETFRRLEFHPRVLQGVAVVDARTEILGASSDLPFALAPTGFTRLMHTDGECGVAKVAERSGVAYTLATMSTTSIEDVATAAPGARRWFQLYVGRDRGITRELIARARTAEYDVLMLTVDSPVGGNRRRDHSNGLVIPPRLTKRSLVEALARPSWWIRYLRAEPLSLPSLRRHDGSMRDQIESVHDASLGLGDMTMVRALWDGKLVVKGIQDPADAQLVAAEGADAVVLSNHGGRQLDRSPTPLTLLARTRADLDRKTEVWLDGGIMSGGDIVAAIAMGASLCLVGRAYLYGLMAGGEAGAQRSVDILKSDIVRTLHLLGVTRIADLSPVHVSIPQAGHAGDADKTATATGWCG